MANTPALGAGGATLGSSSLPLGTIKNSLLWAESFFIFNFYGVGIVVGCEAVGVGIGIGVGVGVGVAVTVG